MFDILRAASSNIEDLTPLAQSGDWLGAQARVTYIAADTFLDFGVILIPGRCRDSASRDGTDEEVLPGRCQKFSRPETMDSHGRAKDTPCP